MDAPKDRVIRGYELREKIGAGGFGAVYRAFQAVVGREVAIKIILPQYANHPDFIRRFEAEAQLVARLEHIHIVPLYDYWREPGGAYLVMRWLHGGSLRSVLHRGPLTPEHAAHLLDQIAAALAAAHRRGVVHRDLKPDNVLLDDDGNAYLADFGIAKNLGGEDFEAGQGNVVVGSPAYLSPEQITGETVTNRADIYSLGVTLYEMLAGQLPFSGVTGVQLMQKHLHDPLPTLRTRHPALDPQMNAVIQRATAKRPADRYQDAPSVASDFRQAIGSGPTAAPTPRPPTRISSHGAPTRRSIDMETMPPGAVPDISESPTLAPGAAPTREAIPGTPDELTLTPDSAVAPIPSTIAYEPTVVEAPTGEVDNPYKGLRAFQQADAADFFGREALVEQLLDRMKETGGPSRFLAVVGPSGSGKSSVVRAGLLPALRNGALPESRDWFLVEMIPSTDPLKELEEALLRVAVNQPANLLAQLREHDLTLLRAVNSILPSTDESELVLVIDQFEEIFTQLENEEERTSLLNNLLAAVNHPTSRLRVIVTLRADFYDRPLLYPAFGNLMKLRTEVVLPLSSDELQRAIVGPAERVGVMLESGLVDAIMTDVGEQPGALPLLQYALTELFERRKGRTLTLDVYRMTGGVLGALARRADELYNELDEAGQQAVRQIFLRMVTPGEGTEDTRRRVPLPELTSVSGNKQVIQSVIDTYGKYRLLTFDRDPQTRIPTVEVAHEALIRTWERLRGWLAESREDLRMQRRLSTSVSEWLNARRDASFLASGTRLDQFEAWVAETTLALTTDERAYLDASLADRDAKRAAEEARKAHEAMLERRGRNRLRILVVVLLIATIGAFGLSAIAVNQQQIAVNNALTATNAQGQAIYNANTATLAQGEALNNAQTAVSNANTATVAQGQAIYNANTATLAQGQALNNAQTAVANAQTATVAQGQAIANAQTAQANFVRAEGQRLAAEALNVMQAKEGNVELAGLLSVSAINRTYSPQTDAALVQATTLNYAERVFEHGGKLTVVALSPDGRYALTCGEDGMVRLWGVQTGKLVRELRTAAVGGTTYIWAASFSPDGRYLVISSAGSHAEVYEVDTGKVIQHFSGLDGEANTVRFSPDGRTILIGAGNTAVLVDVQSSAEAQRFSGHADDVVSGVVSPDGKYLLTGSRDKTARLWDVATGKELRRITDPASTIQAIAFSPDGKLMAIGGSNTSLWDVNSGQKVHEFTGGPQGMAFSPDGKYLLASAAILTVPMWDVQTGVEVRRLSGHTGTVTSIGFSADGRYAITGGWDGMARLWDMQQTSIKQRRLDHPDGVTDVAFSPDGKLIATSSRDKIARLWDSRTGNVIRTLTGHTSNVTVIAFSPDGKLIATGSDDQTARLWDAATGKELRQLTGFTNQIRGLAFSPDSKYLLVASGDTIARLWDVATGKQVRTFESSTSDEVESVAFSPDGRYVLGGTLNGTARLWDMNTGDLVRTLKAGDGDVNFILGVAFSADSRYVLTGSYDRTARLFDLQTGKEMQRFVGHAEGVVSVSMSPDGKYVATSSTDTTARLWDSSTGKELRRLAGHAGFVLTVRFSPDGKTIATASRDQTVRLWDTDYHDSITFICAHIPRDFTDQERAQHGIDSKTPTCVQPDSLQVAVAATWTPIPVTQIAAIAPIEKPRVFTGHDDGVWSVAFSSDNKTIVTAGGDKIIRLWDAAAGKELRQFAGHADAVYCVALSPDGKVIASGGEEKIVRLWDVQTGKQIQQMASSFTATSTVAFSPDGRFVLSGNNDGIARLWDVQTGKEVRRLVGHLSTIRSVTFSRDGKTILTGSTDQTARLWNVQTGEQLIVLIDHKDAVLGVALSPDGKYAVTGGGDFRSADSSGDTVMRLWDVQTGQVLRRLVGHTKQINTVAFSPNGTLIASAGNDSVVRLWDVQTGREWRRLPNETSGIDYVLSITFSPGGNAVLAGTLGSAVRLWDISSAAQGSSVAVIPTPTPAPTATPLPPLAALKAVTFSGSKETIRGVAFSPDGHEVYTGALDGAVRVWNPQTGKQIRQYFGGTVVFSPDGRYVLMGSNTPQLHDVQTGAGLVQYTGHTQPALAGAISPDSQYVVTGGNDNTVRLWNRATGKELRQFAGHTKSVWSATFSPDGKILLTSSLDGTVRLWDVETGSEIRKFTDVNGVGAVFSPDGKTILFTGEVPQLVDVKSGEVLQKFVGHLIDSNNLVTSVAFSPDGKYVLTAGSDKTARLWNAATGEALRIFSGHTGAIWAIAFSPDGKYVLTGSADKTARLWVIESGNGAATPTLTPTR